MSIGLVWDPRLTQRNATLELYDGSNGRTYYKLISARWLDVVEAEGKHHVFIDLWDRNGQRMVGIPVFLMHGNTATSALTESKPGESAAQSIPLHNPGWPYSIRVGSASDIVRGLGLGSIEDPMRPIHTGYHLIFQLSDYGADGPTPPPTTDDALDWESVMRYADILAALARRKLAKGG